MTGTTLVCVTALILLAIGWSLRESFYEWQAKKRAVIMKRLENELEQLCSEISIYSTLRLTTEHIPQRFTSKEAALAFGERWSRGGKSSYSAKSIDSKNHDENHPNFDKTSISGGILYTYPALFYGMEEAHGADDEWFIEFSRAKNKWLKDYLVHLKSGLAS